MKPLYFLIMILIWGLEANAQNPDNSFKSTTILKDTINIYGYVYDFEGHPLKALVWVSLTRNTYVGMKLQTVTDKYGRFELTGVNPYDTISVNTFKGGVNITNNRARFLKIMVPGYASNSFNKNVSINSRRTHAKRPATLSIPFGEKQGSIFPVYDTPAEPFGNRERFESFIKSQLHYTQKAIDENIEGAVTVSFNVNVDGRISEIELIRGLGYGLDQQVINAIKQSPKWHPQLFLGEPVISKQQFSVEFRLTDQ